MIIFSFLFFILHLLAILWVGINLANEFKMQNVSTIETAKENRWDILVLSVLLITFFRVYF